MIDGEKSIRVQACVDLAGGVWALRGGAPVQGELLACERLWREGYGQGLAAAGGLVAHTDGVPRAYEVLFHLMAAATFADSG